jgi:hypothetical protein
MWLGSVSGHWLFFLLVMGYLGELSFLGLAARAGGGGGYWLGIIVVPGC